MNSAGRNMIRGLIGGTVAAFLIELCGYLIVRGTGSDLGWTMFFAVPFATGFVLSAIVRQPRHASLCLIASGLSIMTVLIWTGWEGIVCCLLALPLVILGTLLGAVVGYWIGQDFTRWKSSGKSAALMVLLAPFFIAAADRLERPHRSQQRETFTSATTLDASPDKAWDMIAQMEKLDGPKPFLLSLGLPVPYRCELSDTAVGARRVCHFENGRIAQEVTIWNKPSLMRLRITENTLSGRHWLTFIDASYELFPENGRTKAIRHTTIGTRLYPRWYWRPLERWGVESEHDYVFANLKRRAGSE